MPVEEIQRIVLVGHSGVGKSTLGPFLAKSLAYSFVDMDGEVVARYSRSQTSINVRKEIMEDLLNFSAIVIAAGSEDFCQQISRDRILENSLSIWIIADTAGRCGKTAPSLVGALEHSREGVAAAYKAADLHIDTRGLSVFEAVVVLVDAVRAVGVGVDLSDLRRYQCSSSPERTYLYCSDNADYDGRSRQYLENSICRRVIDAFLSSEPYQSAYVAYSGLWHSEGSKMALISNDPRFATIEIFFFEHFLLPWQTSIAIHQSNHCSVRFRWRSDAVTPDEIETDLLQQLVDVVRRTADSE